MKASPLAHLSKWRRLAPAVALLVVAFALVVGPVSQALAQDGPQAFAVYTADNTTLTLYKAEEVPSVGDTYEGHVVTNVFTIDESDTYFGESPFADVANVVKNVEVADCGDNKISPVSMDHWFEDFTNLIEVDGWEYADTSQVTNMSYTFSHTDLSNGVSAPELNTSSVTNMSNMFSYNKGLKTPDFSRWDVSKVTDMSYMFNNCTALSAPDFSNWNPSSVTTMKQMFYQCAALTSLDFSGWNTPELKNLSDAFFQDAALTSLDFEGWSAPKISNLQSTFNQCSALTELDLSSWGASKVTDTSSTFLGCTSLTTLDLSGIGANGKYGYTFDRCPALSKVTLGAGWSFGDTRSLLPEAAGKLWYKADADGNPTGEGYTPDELAAAWDGATMAGTWVLSDAPAAELEAFAVYCETDKTLTLYKASDKPAEGGVYNNKAATRVFEIDEQATRLSASPFADVKDQVTKVIIAAPESADNKLTPKSMNRWFYDFTSLEQVDGWANADTSQVTDMSYMFYRCNLSKGLDAPNLNTSSVTDMSNMFYGCKGLSSATGPDLSHWDVSNVTDMSSMFRECTALQAPKTSGWDTSSVENMSDMFRGCSSIVTFDLTPWNLGNVEFANRMFSGCSKLTTITLPDENMAALTSAKEMFNGCAALTTVNASTWVAPALTSASNMFYGCRALTSLDLSSLGSIALEDTDGMFGGCSALATLDLSGIGIAEKPIMSAMFTGCSALSKVTLGADWSFADDRGALPSVEGKLWYKADADGNPTGEGYTPDELAEAWAGATMAGTWVLSEPIVEPVVPEAFAIYDSSDKSLTIYKASDKPEVGDTYHGKTVSQVFGINEETTWFSTSPFIQVQGSLKSVTFAEPEDPENKLAPASLNYWFKDFRQIKSIDGWENVDGSRVKRMENAFQGCEGLQEIDLSSVSFTGVANMSRLFEGCTGLKSANLSGLVGPNVTNISYMFYCCAALSDLDVSNWNTTGVTSLYGIFQDCAFLKELDLSSWDLAKVSNANWTFTDSAVEKVTLGAGFRFVDGNDSYLPEAAGKLWYKLDAEGNPVGDGYSSDELAEAWDGATMAGTWVLVDEIRPETSAFAVYSKDDKSLTIYKASDKPARNDTYNGKTVTYVFTIDETKTNYSSSPFSGYAREYESVVFAAPEYADDKIAPASMSNWFSGFEKAKSITGWENVDGSNIQSMSRAFEYCYALSSIDLSDLRLTKATDLSWLFNGCTSLESADLTGLVRSGVTTITYMFNNCSALTELNLLSWNTSGITENNANWMFNGVTSLKKVTLGDRFDFVAGYGVSLPDVAGKLWYLTDENGDPTGAGYTGEDLAEAWDGDTMCGTWVLSEPIAESGPEAFAVYCEADKTLTIYKASDKPTEGGQYNGKAATRVFDIDETATSLSASPFAEVAEDVTLVQIAAPESADDKLTPACTAHWFDGFANLTQVADWQNADTSQVTDMSYMYRGCDLSNGFDAPDLKTGSVTTMSHMFDGCTGLAAPSLANFDMSSVTDMSYMFNGCTRLSATSISGWNVSSATNMSHMFAGCASLPASFDLSGWTAPAALADASGMFDGCTSLTSLDFTDFGFAEGATTTDMLKGCTALTTVKLGAGWSFEGGVRLPSAEGKLWFKDGDSETTGYDPDGLADAWTAEMAGTWQLADASEPEPEPVAFGAYSDDDKTLIIYKASDKPNNGEVYKGRNIKYSFNISETADWFSQTPFYSAKDSIEKVIFAEPEDQNNKIAPVSMRKWFDSVNRLKSIEGWENVDGSNLTDMSYLFYGTRLASIDLSALKAPKLETIESMFGSCLELKTANLSGLVTASTTDASNLFLGCSNLESVDVSKWDTSGMKSMTSVFQRCRDLTEVDLSSWTTTDAVNMKWMFNESGITKVTLGTGFNFGSNPSQTSLPDAEGKLWYKLDDSGSPVRPGYTGEELATSWDGSTMAGTWQLTTELEEPEPEPVELAGLTASDSLTYGETLTVTFTPKSGDDVIASGTATLKLGDTVLATVSEPQEDGSFSLSYNTADKGVALGEQTLTVTFESTGYEAATGTVETTLSAKSLTVEVTSSLDKTWDGSDEVDGLAVELLGALEDDDVTVSATGAYASSDAGEQDVTLTLALSGDDAAWYTVSAPTDLAGTINAADIAGKLSLSGTPAFGETLTATYEPTSGEQVSYTWTRDGQVIDGATGSTYTLSKEDVGAQIAVVATASDANHTGSVTSDAVTVAKATQDAPAAPVATATSHTTIEVEELADSPAGAKAEYSIDGGKTWQTETTFSGLEPETEYTVIARFQELDTHEASEVSEGTTVSTPAAPLPTFTVSVSAEGQGTVDGGGTYEQGTSVTVTATAAEGHHFVAWLVDGEQVSTEASYTFVVETDVALVAQFEQDEPDTPDPDDPDTPDNPDPEEPDKPDTPDPDKPADTKPGEQPKPEIPATGDAGAVAALVTALVGAGALGLGAYRRRS